MEVRSGQLYGFQWHITHKCNLRCRHCYLDEYAAEPSLMDLVNVLGRIIQFLQEKDGKCTLAITGGEPFLSPYLFQILEYVEAEERIVNVCIATNGTIITSEIIKKLKQFKKVTALQISIDGVEETHDAIRGKGNFKKSMEAIRLISNSGLNCSVSFTANRINYKEFAEVAKLSEKAGANLCWTDRVVPLGDEDKKEDIIKNLILTDEEFKGYIDTIKKAKDITNIVDTGRKLLFLYMPQEKWHGCAPGMTSFTITADCELMPCRRLEENFGSILNKSIEDIRQENKRALLQILKLPDECKQCKYHKICHGGAKCITYAVYGTYNKPDPNCQFLKKETSENNCIWCDGCTL